MQCAICPLKLPEDNAYVFGGVRERERVILHAVATQRSTDVPHSDR